MRKILFFYPEPCHCDDRSVLVTGYKKPRSGCKTIHEFRYTDISEYECTHNLHRMYLQQLPVLTAVATSIPLSRNVLFVWMYPYTGSCTTA